MTLPLAALFFRICFLVKGSQSDPQTAVSAPPDNLIKMQIISLHHKPSDSKLLGVGPLIWV